MKSHSFLLPQMLLIACLVSSILAQKTPDSGTAFVRARHLRHGINASEWFAQSSDYSPKRLNSHTTQRDIELIKQMGFDHVRLSIDPEVFECLLNGRTCEAIQILDGIVSKCLTLDLAVIVDVHPNSEFKRALATGDPAVERLAALWKKVGLHFNSTDSDRVFFEIMNEPEMRDPYRWAAVQHKVLLAIRSVAPLNTVIVSGARWSDIEDLVVMEPFAESNLIYNFHYYEPHIFTHQGATWGEYFWGDLRKIPYPSSPEGIRVAMRSIDDEFERWQLTKYGLEKWDRERVNGEVAFAAEWAHVHKVPLICNEFGVYRNFSDDTSRALWLSDVRRALENNGVGWTMWDYRGGFGVVTMDTNGARPDATVLNALGLIEQQTAN
jgi:endoglucanase